MSEIQDPKSVQDLTGVVQTLLQQMQDKFQTMSDQIIGRNILPFYNFNAIFHHFNALKDRLLE
uniref:Heat shock factor-binding protein 1 n=1 Tax=Oncorhynchus tshawytscha TaxID=74940 RepID=A0AAZ3RIH4_ONCTS